ncbi:hypothetical protein KGF86_02330 [Ornithinibacillus massiliensis]|uniref:DUF4367 domain-containing protein n=1 Tax=Ornithinibacillus massiliensis TaxID=1944633 RepID=A0ABS5MA54_9BACI|nr:hypothetical protein [Ornithinibacillus massiliensis]MBS3679040.1 hypothetical protein [Ornithinibacillus massiliensis]
MDKQFKDLKNEFNQIPTSFTENDKQAVRNKIAELTNEPIRKSKPAFPVWITASAITAVALLLIVVVQNQMGMMISSNDTNGAQNEMASFDSDESEVEAGMAMEESMEDHASTFDQEASNRNEEADSLLFNPDTIEPDMWLGNMKVKEVEHQGEETIITFRNHEIQMISGQFTNDEPLSFIPEGHLPPNWLPLADRDAHGNVKFYFTNEELANQYKDSQNHSIITLEVSEVSYHYSPDGSEIYLTIMDE